MITIYLTPRGEELQQKQHEIGFTHTVSRAWNIAMTAFIAHDSTVDGLIQTVSDKTGYVYDEFQLYKYEAPKEAIDGGLR